MKLLLISLTVGLVSCQALNPAFFTAAEEVLTNDVCSVDIQKDAVMDGKEVRVTIEVTNGKLMTK